MTSYNWWYLIVYLEGFCLLNLFWNQLMDNLAIFERNFFAFCCLLILTIFSCNVTTILNRFWFATSIRLVFTFLIRFSFGLLYFLTFCLSLNHQIWIFEVVITNCYLLYLHTKSKHLLVSGVQTFTPAPLICHSWGHSATYLSLHSVSS